MMVDPSGKIPILLIIVGVVLLVSLQADNQQTPIKYAMSKYEDKINIVGDKSDFIYEKDVINILITPGDIEIENSYRFESGSKKKPFYS